MAYPTPHALLRKHGLQPKHSWGQNFLVDASVYDFIVKAAEVRAGERVVEIGAGLGTLTARLVAAGAQVIAVERDRDMVAVLRAELPELELLEQNAMDLDLAPLAAQAGGPVTVVGNLPYNIASPLVLRLLVQHRSLRRLIVMLQREVAERMVAPPGGAAYGALSVLCQTWARGKLLRRVPPTAFLPPPKVESALVRLEPAPPDAALIPDEARYRRVIDAAFQMRRKQLRNALAGLVDAEGFAAAGIDPQRRGETLSVAEFAALARTPRPGA